MPGQDRRHFLATAAATAAGLELTMGHTVSALLRHAVRQQRGPLQALKGATTWLNTPPLGESQLQGKVVLVNFCTYTCINWLRQLPYVRAWDAKYRAHGLTVIGAHTPEFGFEHDVDNVRQALKTMRIDYPIAVDNGYDIWNGFSNAYWPALYLMDSTGKLQYRQFGEGEYDRTERWIQKLLAEAGADGFAHALVNADPRGIETGADWKTLQSPENYLGSARTDGFVSQRNSTTRDDEGYLLPDRLRLNQWGVIGNWLVHNQSVALQQPKGKIAARFHARDLHLVMGPVNKGTSVRFRVRIDGQAPGTAHGLDIDEQGIGAVTDQRLYQLVRQPGPIDDRNFEIEFLDAGVEAYAFTFG